MTLIRKRGTWAFDQLKTIGIATTINSQSVIVTERNAAGYVKECYGTVTITDAGAGYAKGCTYIKTDASGDGEYTNIGTTSSCQFVLSSSIGDITGVTAGDGLNGGGSSGAVSLSTGYAVYNNTGGTLAAGTLVYLAGFTTTNGVTVAKADADAGLRATHVVKTAINNNTAGVVYPIATVTGLATNGQTIGDPVYLDATTAGGFVFAAPTGADQLVQIVGYVKVVDATVGEICFIPGLDFNTKLPTSWIQALAIGTAQLAANAVTSAKLDVSTIQYAEVALTNAEMLALRATPKTLVAAPGAGKMIEFLSAEVLFDYVGAYTESDDNMAIKYNNGAGAAVSETIESTGFVDATADSVIKVAPATSAVLAKTASENLALVLHNTGDGEFGGGNAGNAVRVKVAYRVHNTGF